MAEETKMVNESGTIGNIPTPPVTPSLSTNQTRPGRTLTFEELDAQASSLVKPSRAKEDIPYSSFYIGDRYPSSIPGVDPEEEYARQQSVASKWVNGTLKTAGTFTSSFLSGTTGIVEGIAGLFSGQGFDKIVDNESNKLATEFNSYMEDRFPNYYQKVETDAEWWEPSNILSANFWSDKVLKNLGYSAGSLAGGLGWGKVLKLVGATNKLVNAGRAMEAAAEVEAAMTAVPKAQKFAAIENALTSLSKQYIKPVAANVLKNSERILMSATGSIGEGAIESYTSSNRFRQEAIEEYKRTYGKAPEGDDLQEINDYADRIANVTVGANFLLLSATNYFQLPKILGASRKAEKAMMYDIAQNKLGGVYSSVAREGIGKTLYRASNVLGLGFSASEAFEEFSQYAIEKGVSDFFDKGYRNKDQERSFFSDIYGAVGNIFGEGIERALTDKEGLESLLIGGVSGGIQQVRGEIVERGLMGEGGIRKKNTDIAIAALGKTNIQQALSDQAKFITIGNAAQQERQQYIANDDVLNEKDSEHDVIMSYMMPRVKYGKVASIQEELGMYEAQAMTEEGFQELVSSGVASVNEERDQFLDRVGKLMETAKSTEKLYSELNDRYVGIVDDDQTRKYDDLVIDKMVYAASKIDYYNKRIPQMSTELQEIGVNVTDVLSDIIENGKPNKEATRKALDEINDITKTSTDTLRNSLKEKLIDIIELGVRRKNYIDEYNKIKDNPKKYSEGEPDLLVKARAIQPAEVSQIIPGEEDAEGKPKLELKQLELGKEYSIGEPYSRYDNKIVLAPKIQVLSTTLGGEYQVKMPDGKIEFLKPKDFEKYALLDDDVASDDIANLLDNAIENVLSKRPELVIPEEVSPIDFVNSLDDKELMDKIFENFKKLQKDYAKQKKKESTRMSKVLKNKKALSAIINTGDPVGPLYVYNAVDNERDARKPDYVIPLATIASSKILGYQNSIVFGSNFANLPNRKNIRGILVTKNNEKAAGVEGLIDHIINNTEGVDASTYIAMLMVEIDPKTNQYKTVNLKGEAVDFKDFNNQVFQAMPLEDLKWSEEFKSQTMFREGTPQTVQNAIRDEYKKFRSEILKDKNINIYEIEPSFGIPQYNPNNEQTPVTDAKLITDAQLRTERVLKVYTSETSDSLGYVKFNNVSGKVFLKTRDVLAPVQNQLHTEEKATVIYKVLQRLSETLEEGTFEEEGMPLIKWLQTVVYWGVPNTPEGKSKPSGRNSIFFESSSTDDSVFKTFNLTVSNKGDKFPFNPESLKANKQAIINIIKTMYHNVYSARVNGKDYNTEYVDILDVLPDGKLKVKRWNNYQSYLLSSEGRETRDIPVTTPMKPVYGEDQTNREGIYFVIQDNVDRYKQAVAKVKNAEGDPIIAGSATPGQVEVKIAKVEETPSGRPGVGLVGDLGFGNDYINTFRAPFGELKFTVSKFLYESGNPSAILFTDDSRDAINKGFESSKQIDPDRTLKQYEVDLKDTVFSMLDVPYQEPTEEVVAEEAPTVTPPTEVEEPTDVPKTPIKSSEDILKDMMEGDSSLPKTRLMEENFMEGYEIEDWKDIEKFLKSNFPKLPVGRVMNMLKTRKGRTAFGMYKTGMVYIYQNAEVGTIYHEVFHAVMDMFLTPQERAEILNEVRSRKPEYKNLTDRQIEEIAAEDARNFFQFGKVPQKVEGKRSWLANFLRDLVNIIKEFFLGKQSQSKLESLFRKMGSGYYRDYASAANNQAPGIVDIETLPPLEDDGIFSSLVSLQAEHDIIQHMTYMTVVALTNDDRGLQEIGTIDKDDLMNKLLNSVRERVLLPAQKANIILDQIEKGEKQFKNKEERDDYISRVVAIRENAIQKADEIAKPEQWASLTRSFDEKLTSLGISYDEEAIYISEDPYRTGRGDYQDSRKIDNFKNSSVAVKLLLASLPIHAKGKRGAERSEILSTESGINGVILLPASEAYMAIMNAVHDSTDVNDMIENIRLLAIYDPNYIRVYTRLTNGEDPYAGKATFKKINRQHQVNLINSFWRTFKKQNPEVKNIYILDNGDLVVGDSNFTTAVRQTADVFENSIKGLVKKDNPYFEYKGYDVEEGKFVRAWYGVDNKELREKLDGYKQDIPSMVEFLKTLDIAFNVDDIMELPEEADRDKFKSATAGLIDTIKSSSELKKKIVTMTDKVLNIRGRLLELAEIDVKINNPEFSSTYFNIQGERVQTFLGINLPSELYNTLSKITNINDLVDTDYEYLLTDDFSKGSQILYKIFDKETGDKIDGSEGILKTAYVDGMIDSTEGRNVDSSKLTVADRFITELNMNLNGYYSNLVPGDSAIEHYLKIPNVFSYTGDFKIDGLEKAHSIFKDYIESEIAVSRDPNRPVELGVGGRKRTDLRFFKSILKKESAQTIEEQNKLHDDIVKYSIENPDKSTEEVYNAFAEKIREATERYLDNAANRLGASLINYGIIEYDKTTNKDTINNINFSNRVNVDRQVTLDQLKVSQVNYMVANIEMHKLIYSDPYQYEDELKRIKNFTSPRQALAHGSPELNSKLDELYNQGLTPGDVGYTSFSDEYFTTTVYEDVVANIPNLLGYDGWKESDGAGIIQFPAYRRLRILADNWNALEERQYQYDMAYYKKKKKIPLTQLEKDMYALGNPEVRSAYTTIKPIAAGNQGSELKINKMLLDKFALMPLSYRIMDTIARGEETNATRLYEKMTNEKVDYVVFKSARKVGAGELNPAYKDGILSDDPYVNVSKIPVSILSIQTEVPSKSDEKVTEGSQATKLMTLDMLVGGVPVDFVDASGTVEFTDARLLEWYGLTETQKKRRSPLYKEIVNNRELLEESIDAGYQNLLRKMGMKEIKRGGKTRFEIFDNSIVAQTLREEILKREVNSNISKALNDFISGKAVLEATPAYQQIRNILYSIADRNITSRKISGGQKIQVTSTFLESVRGKKTTDAKGKDIYESEVLKFYNDVDEKGNPIRVAEVMVGRWFPNPENLSDAELIEKLNKEILSGVAFRIPSQKQNSIDRFVIKGFLPTEFGDNVVIPSALVNKSGSDFDIDKLMMYFKNVYYDGSTFNLIPFYGYGNKAKESLKKLYLGLMEKRMAGLKDSLGRTEKFVDAIKKVSKMDPSTNFARKINTRLYDGFTDFIIDGRLDYNGIINALSEKAAAKGKKLEELSDKELQNEIADEVKESWYIKSLQNEYIKSSENLVSSKENYDQLIKPNSAEPLKDLSKEILELSKVKSFDYTNPGNMLNRIFMLRLRNAFVSGKYAIGIAATNQTGHSLAQRLLAVLDPESLNDMPRRDRRWLRNNKITFREYNTVTVDGVTYPTISKVLNSAGDYISDILGMFIDGYVDIAKGPWIMELGVTPNVASTWMFLTRVGVPIQDIAYFMNQPIIKAYLRELENTGRTWLFNDEVVENVMKKYSYDRKTLSQITKIPPTNFLRSNVGKTSFTKSESTLQVYMLLEFLKYAKMAENLFKVSQATNYDTATFNDPFLLMRKNEQITRARTNVFKSLDPLTSDTVPLVDGLLTNSFLGKLGSSLDSVRDAYSNFLKADQRGVRDVIQKVLAPYYNLPERDFLKISQKVVADLFDWSVQIDKGLNNDIQRLILSDNVNTAGIMNSFITTVQSNPKHPMHNNHVIKLIQPIFSESRESNKPNNLKLANTSNKVYDQNQIINSFRQLRDYLEGINRPGFYKSLIRTAVLQSGISGSPISFTSLLPYEDFVDLYNSTLSTLTTSSKFNINDFVEISAFHRNNWSNDDIIPYRKPIWRKTPMTGEMYLDNGMGFGDYPEVKEMLDGKKLPPLYRLYKHSRGSDSDYVVLTWEDYKMSRSEKSARRRDGDYSFRKRALFKKVYIDNNVPLMINENKRGEPQEFVYRMINAWGDSFRLKEFYDTPQKSLVDNGFEKVEDEMTDKMVVDAFWNMGMPYGDFMEMSEDELLEDYSQTDGTPVGESPVENQPEEPATQPTIATASGMLTLRDNNRYEISKIDANLLDRLGYTAKEAGKLLKSIC